MATRNCNGAGDAARIASCPATTAPENNCDTKNGDDQDLCGSSRPTMIKPHHSVYHEREKINRNKMNFQIKKASRKGIIPLIGLFGKSGYGKTYSALLLARGLVGEKGIIRLVDTEKGRGEIFADDIPGGYEVVSLDEPFTPERYEKAAELAADGADVLVIDSMSHSWEGEEGVLEVAEAREEKSGKGQHNWTHKAAHSRMLRKICRFSIPVIVCMRSKDVIRQVKDERGKTVFVHEKNTIPVQDKTFIFDMLLAFEMKKNEEGDAGYIRIEKYTSNRLLPVLPKNNERITIAHGAAIADWCNGSEPVSVAPDLKAAKAKLWELTKSKHGGNPANLRQWLTDECLLEPEMTLEELTIDQLSAITKKAEQKLK